MSGLKFEYHRGGIHLPELNLWLDPHHRCAGAERVFVSHAHADHTGRHREVILTEATWRFMQARLGGKREAHVLPFHETREFPADEHGGAFKITLMPAGHIFGSAMSLIEAGGESLLYTGDFKLRPGLTAEACEPCHADTLIMETTFGHPRYQFPPAEDVLRDIVQFCKDALANGETPVLLAYSLGKSQELHQCVGDAGLPVRLHPQGAKMARLYRELGHALPDFEELSESNAKGAAVIWPPSAKREIKLGKTRKAAITGWAVDARSLYRYRADAVFPLSDHADFPELLEFVRRVGPKRVFTLHGFAADFAAALRDEDMEAWALSEEDQLRLRLE